MRSVVDLGGGISFNHRKRHFRKRSCDSKTFVVTKCTTKHTRRACAQQRMMLYVASWLEMVNFLLYKDQVAVMDLIPSRLNQSISSAFSVKGLKKIVVPMK